MSDAPRPWAGCGDDKKGEPAGAPFLFNSRSPTGLGNQLLVGRGMELRVRPLLVVLGLAALAVVRTLSAYGLSALIKWPNDVLVAGAKICGILCETAGNDAAMVVGIGVNINSSQGELADVGQPATSVLAQTGREICPEGFLKKILDELAALFDQFERLGLAAIIDPLRHYLAYKGERISLAVSDRIHDGRIVGLNEEGALLFECERDGLLTVSSGEMSVRRPG